ncbi:hypothetical protein [Sphaerimonospora thailandensis]|nr:hypothetical protein [Sphaerimonospora thailandensis]
MTTPRPRTTCPTCGRAVVQRRDGTPAAHYPPLDRLDLTWTGRAGGHCRAGRDGEVTR